MSARRIAAWAVAVVMVGACGSAGSVAGGARPTPSGPQPTLTPPQLASYDAQLLSDLKAIDFQVFETDIIVGRYVMRNGGLDYDKKSFGVEYSALVIDEWKAMAFNPDSGKCSTQYPQYTWNCSYLATSPRGHRIYAGPVGGLNGYPPDLADVYVELATTVLNVKGAAGNVPSLGDLDMMVDALSPVTPEEAVRRNQRARDNTQYLVDTAATRVDFKTYVPTAPLQNFALDRKILDNPSRPDAPVPLPALRPRRHRQPGVRVHGGRVPRRCPAVGRALRNPEPGDRPPATLRAVVHDGARRGRVRELLVDALRPVSDAHRDRVQPIHPWRDQGRDGAFRRLVHRGGPHHDRAANASPVVTCDQMVTYRRGRGTGFQGAGGPQPAQAARPALRA